MPYPGEAESVKGFVMNFSTGEIIDTFIPLRKVEYCTKCLLHIIIYMRTLVAFYFSNFVRSWKIFYYNVRYSKGLIYSTK